MGFSVSGSLVVIFLAVFISFGIAYTAGNNGLERVNDAYEEKSDSELTRQNTEININSTNPKTAGGEEYFELTVYNNGSTALSVNDTDILLDGNYINLTGGDMETLEVDGNSNTDLWLPGEELQVNISVTTQPSQVKIVSGPGVADSEVV